MLPICDDIFGVISLISKFDCEFKLEEYVMANFATKFDRFINSKSAGFVLPFIVTVFLFVLWEVLTYVLKITLQSTRPFCNSKCNDFARSGINR